MNDETPEMEELTAEMREVMSAWIANPDNEALKARYKRLQAAYQRAFLRQKASDMEQPGGTEAAHQAYS